MSQEMEMARAEAVQQKYTDDLMSRANVVGVGVGLVGTDGGEQVGLVVMVTKKLPLSQLAPDDIIPKELDGVPIAVQEMGVFEAQ
jgi:hypothetical protein